MTTTPAAWEPLETALRQRRPIQVTYHGRQRLLCPHALGWHNTRPLVLAYQTGGDTSTGALPADPRKRWRCLFIDEIDHVTTPEPATAWGSADNYNPTHPFNTNTITVITVAIGADDHHAGR